MALKDNDVVIIGGVRSPFAPAMGVLKDISAGELGAHAFKELVYRLDIPVKEVEEVIMGCAGGPSDEANTARVSALLAGLPEKTSAFSVQRNCASALESVTSAFIRLKAGALDMTLAGGAESMSGYPLLFSKGLARGFGDFIKTKTLSKKLKLLLQLRLKDLKPRIALAEGLTDPFVGLSMGETAEVLSKEFGITREAQDRYALASHQKAVQAKQKGVFAEEIAPLVTEKNFVEEDQGPRENQSLDKLGRLRPYFDRKYGTVTVGNACPVTDGAAALWMMSWKKAKSLSLKPSARICSFAYAGCSPKRMGLGPLFSTALALKAAHLKLKDIDLIELNEAFSAQVLACLKAFASKKFAEENLNQSEALGEIDLKKLNVNGGAIALGHPVGATGARLVLTLMNEMKRQRAQYGLASLCIGGGQGGSLILEHLP